MSETQIEALLRGSIELVKLRRMNGLLRLQTDMQRDKIKQLAEENARLRARLNAQIDEYNAAGDLPALLRPQV